jgi:hypothetical protein
MRHAEVAGEIETNLCMIRGGNEKKDFRGADAQVLLLIL